jgi:phosphate/sulfate permease
MDITLFLMLFGFVLAAYSIIANDAIQTLGTFLSSNSHRPWWVLWIFIALIFTAVILYGWYSSGHMVDGQFVGDVAYERLSKFPVPENFTWLLVIPPLIILFLTKWGIPVSTTFLVLTVFAPTNLEKMLTKSLLGYLVAFVSAIILYFIISKIVEEKFIKSKPHETNELPTYWIVLQWLSTAFLWSQWLIQDLANIFVYMPSRELSGEYVYGSIALIWIMLGYILYNRGGAIQGIVNSKTNTSDIRTATIIDIVFGLILLFFKEWSNIPMSTTWVFLGLLAGREIALSVRLNHRTMKDTTKNIGFDIAKAFFGLAVSVAIAFSFPILSDFLN